MLYSEPKITMAYKNIKQDIQVANQIRKMAFKLYFRSSMIVFLETTLGESTGQKHQTRRMLSHHVCSQHFPYADAKDPQLTLGRCFCTSLRNTGLKEVTNILVRASFTQESLP